MGIFGLSADLVNLESHCKFCNRNRIDIDWHKAGSRIEKLQLAIDSHRIPALPLLTWFS